MNLEDYSMKEIEREYRKRKLNKPESLNPPEIDIRPLKKIVEEYINYVWDEVKGVDDYKHWIFESAITCFYGNDIWPKINERI
jgi:hypothetical protein